jgi:hypothetical protein
MQPTMMNEASVQRIMAALLRERRADPRAKAQPSR